MSHGTRACGMAGCQRAKCKKAVADYMRGYRDKRAGYKPKESRNQNYMQGFNATPKGQARPVRPYKARMATRGPRTIQPEVNGREVNGREVNGREIPAQIKPAKIITADFAWWLVPIKCDGCDNRYMAPIKIDITNRIECTECGNIETVTLTKAQISTLAQTVAIKPLRGAELQQALIGH
jgi:hypothetical protein